MKKFYLLRQLKNKWGTSLVEVIIVIAVLAILASAIIPNLKFLRQQSIAAELDKMQILCGLLHEQATCLRKQCYLVLDKNSNTYSYYNDIEKFPENIVFGYTEGISGPPANPKKKITSAITFPNNKIVFHKNGTISAGTLYLKDKSSKDLYALTVPVSQVSFIRKYKYQNGKWIYLE